jgi:hypothetical protein
MYKNPLKSVNISDNNSLKKQRDYGKIVKKYETVKLKTEPNELQKYYQYQTYQQPILDELNYVAERMRTEDIKTKNDDYNFIEDLKIKREKLMKETATAKKEIGTETLFDEESIIKQEDMTPVIATDLEFEIIDRIENNNKEQVFIQEYKNDLFGSGDGGIDDILAIADTAPIKEEIFEISKKPRRITQPKTPEQLAAAAEKKAEIFEISKKPRRITQPKTPEQLAAAAEKKAERAAKKLAEKEAKKLAEKEEKFSNIPANKRKARKERSRMK